MVPETEKQLSECIEEAQAPLAIFGGGTRAVNPVGAGARLSTRALAGITLYDPGALTLVAKSGTPVAEIEATLAAQNQRLAFEPLDHRGLHGRGGAPTIGGAVAANVSGPRRVQVGACRDHLLGVRFVDGRGDILKNGGRVMKNVTGYDLVKLMAGSHGTLGVLSEVSLKVLPEVEAVSTVLIEGLNATEAVGVMSRAMGSPYEVSGAAHDPQRASTMLRVEGFSASVEYRAKALSGLFSHASVSIEEDRAQAAQRWQEVRDVAMFHDAQTDVWRISCVAKDAAKLAAAAGGEALFDWAGGLIWVSVPIGTDLRAKIGTFEGHATRVRARNLAQDALPVFTPEPAPIARFSAGLRQKFDPKGILNTGLMG
jgi:glycolate oxidase FAD binding subunit